MSGLLNAITEKPLVALVVVSAIVAAAVLKYMLRKPPRPKGKSQHRPKKQRRSKR